MNKVYLLLGSNMGNSKKHLLKATHIIQKEIGTLLRQSSFYQTAAWGNTDQPDFWNQVIIVSTKMDAARCMHCILEIEHQMGRVRTSKNAPRIIDIDILYFNKEIHNSPTLTVPHPAIAQRRFVLTPLNEISPQFVHPMHHLTNHQLLKQCSDTLNVKKI